METVESEWIGVTPEEILKLEEAIESLKKNGGIPHNEVMARFRNKIDLFYNSKNSTDGKSGYLEK